MTYLGKPKIFSEFPEIIFGFSKKVEKKEFGKYNYNMSLSIGDDPSIVEMNRSHFFGRLGLNKGSVVVQRQTHSRKVNFIEEYENDLEGDALISVKQNLGLAVSTADCNNIYMYDPVKKIIAAVHSGWAGTEKRILLKTLEFLFEEKGSKAENLFVYFGPAISAENYEVGLEFKDKFHSKYLYPGDRKYKLDLKSANLDMLLGSGIKEKQIEVSEVCTFANEEFHSYRRDKQQSGRALGIIAIKRNDE